MENKKVKCCASKRHSCFLIWLLLLFSKSNNVCCFLQQQVLRLLVNLSCNANNLDGLLEFKVCEPEFPNIYKKQNIKVEATIFQDFSFPSSCSNLSFNPGNKGESVPENITCKNTIIVRILSTRLPSVPLLTIRLGIRLLHFLH